MSSTRSEKRQTTVTGASRRNFLVATGAGVAVAGVTAAVPTRRQNAASQQPIPMPTDTQPLVAHIGDPASGSISFLVGDREIVVHDIELVARLMVAARSAGGTGRVPQGA